MNQNQQSPLVEGFLMGTKALHSRKKYKDPFDRKYLGNPKRITKTQKEVWPYIRDTYGCHVALIGGKGSAKTATASAFGLDRIQRYPGSKGFIAASTYQQATESCAAEMVSVCNRMKIQTVYYEKKTLDNIPHRHVYHFPEFNSVICIRSADNMDMIEGSQWDFAIVEEVSFWAEIDLKTAISRVRRGVGDNSNMIVGMPENPDHYMYRYFEENNYLLREINTRENIQNLPPDYIERLMRLYPGDLGRKYINGERVSLHNLPLYSSYDESIHKNGPLAKKYTHYNEYSTLYVAFDFNVAPCCATVWQIKEIPFECVRDGVIKRVVKNVLCQIDEFETWNGGTRQTCISICDKYGVNGLDHMEKVVVIGDASGNHEDTRNVSVTDWTIINDEFKKSFIYGNVFIKKGLIVNRKRSGSSRSRIRRRSRDKKQELKKYSNPPLKDRIINLNSLHRDQDGNPAILYLPKSHYPSGGCAASVSSMKYKANGDIDQSNDKLEGKNVRRSHYSDTAGYMAWFFRPPKRKRKRSGKSTKRNTSRRK